ncbi:conserved Plasmodium protein, unknown function [Plasmodium knowlesi strain H]|uniref:Uncharacterized protein n=3 Tax=Plasmodium knowlesi TaxID=5850 RepID=B3L080_PLAKH|nr:conserved protein, unknown function [Plasmodium knowlesi strain H]OTN68551.1 Uncharacterized protein PKNOH_S02306800 [Plasmodium knowlesi]CAA9986569.1 conserved protein, unknown function [Plasmodium knowlesi strain H]SBO24160.1 conserved Plasmodium protein, unknown function [Plasmodium knowlesi strain H]VVS76043.1 conserved protein, unknown function [Plasmodium knowlesi strain H]|eukprot:XP_002261110.1 hypothetical protein, conserved in Plasmodium species [Plasmodium knowlesi strain H]
MVEIRLTTKYTSCEFHLDFNEVKLPDDVNILKDLEKEVENSIYHLKRSNDEIKKFDPEGADQDLLMALNENRFSLCRKEERLRIIKDKIRILDGPAPDSVGQTNMVATPVVCTGEMNQREGIAQTLASQMGDQYINDSDGNGANDEDDANGKVCSEVPPVLAEATEEKKNSMPKPGTLGGGGIYL